METVSLKAHTRETRGKGAARVLRREGRIPAVLYGRETAATPISVELRALETILREGPGNVFIDLNIEEEAGAK
ncbi:MAG: 50S ribosomal protein L25, partial [Desulfococcaceae bacterium]